MKPTIIEAIEDVQRRVAAVPANTLPPFLQDARAKMSANFGLGWSSMAFGTQELLSATVTAWEAENAEARAIPEPEVRAMLPSRGKLMTAIRARRLRRRRRAAQRIKIEGPFWQGVQQDEKS